ncbi:RNA-binding domain-containing protein [Thiorhodovibrio frisius]|uniref:Putative transcriptional regulator with HTH domain n=1 Tax=Thiorhodovibrio frisius TaxID=631362 RepID=H8Z4G9_9GAMM|nr:RNA-binding domain-containing protein [Thiorhodovibrio frisius]EIC20226.1 putative transcriptional regulator with HTH domain [Thiorhodovibrio frisius]WPL20963.1 Divergent AAA domain protein [Thiorhodovibrio frisius]
MPSITDLWRQGENSAVEFKSASVRPESLAHEMVAFANTDGGSILLGVEDDGRVSGIGTELDYEQWAANIARNNVVPALDARLSIERLENQRVLLIDIPKGRDKPYQTNTNQFLVRVGSTNRVATQQELMRLFQQAGVFHFDLTPVERASIQSLDLSKIDAYFQRYDVDFEQDENRDGLLINTDILTEERLPTLAGLLVFGINPQRYLSDACISFAHFAGAQIDEELIDKQVIGGTLDRQVEGTLAVIKNNLREGSIIEGAKTRPTDYYYPDKVFRELLVNACVHRNYAIHGSRIRVFLFSDRIEVISPGRLPNTVTIEKLRCGVSYAVNPVLVKFMENLRFIDKLGRGLPMVYREAVTHDRQVIFEEVGEEFRVILGLHDQA